MDLARIGRLGFATALAFAAVSGAGEREAQSADIAIQLAYDAASGCPDAERFASVVQGRLGYDPFRDTAHDRVIVKIEASGRTLEGHLEWRNSEGGSIGEQSFPSKSGDCTELTRAMGFTLALQIQLMAATAAESRPIAPVAPTVRSESATLSSSAVMPTAVQGPRTTPDVVVSGARSRGPSIVVAGAGVSAGLGVASDAVALGRIFASVGWPHFALELAAEVSIPSTTHRSDGTAFSQEERLMSAAGCGVIAAVSACAVGKIGEVRTVGQGIDVPLTSSGLMLQTGVRLAVADTVGQKTYIAAHVDGLARLTQATVTLDMTPVWTTPRFVALFGVDLGFRFR